MTLARINGAMFGAPFVLIYRLHRRAIDARRENRTARYFAWSLTAGVCASIILLVAAWLLLVFWKVGLWWFGLLLAGFLMTPVLGPLAIRYALVPLGAVRSAYLLGCASRPGKDPVAYGLACGAWAVSHARTNAGEVWLARRRDVRRPLGDGEVVCTALVAAARGDADTARQLLRSVVLLVEDHPAVRELAGEWLAVDAAERGAWRELAADAAAASYPASPLTFLLEGVAARRCGAAGAPTSRELWARWLLAPMRRHTYELVIAALGEPIAARSEDSADVAADDERAPLPRAISAHLAFSASEPNAIALAATVRAWDAALSDGATHSWLARRALELDAPLGAVDRALREIASTVTDDLARLADTAQLGAPPSHGPIGDGLSRRLRHGRLDSLEAGFTRWANRRTTGESYPAIDEWREFIALRAAYLSAVTAGGLELRRLAFPHAHTTGSNMAAWLWNSRNEHVLSHAISKWLLAEALAVGDTEAIELGHRNCALYVPTRT